MTMNGGVVAEVELDLIHETGAAYLFEDDTNRRIWIPKSLVIGMEACGAGDTYIVEIPEWKAKQEGLI